MAIRQPGDSGSSRPGASRSGSLAAARQSWGGLALAVGLLAATLLFSGTAMLIVVLAVIAMIFLHELGHYLTARAAGMKVTEFFF